MTCQPGLPAPDAGADVAARTAEILASWRASWTTAPAAARLLAEAEARTALLQQQVRDLEAERDGWEPLTASLNRSLAVERATVERLRAELHAVKADPVARRAADGTVTVDWPEGARSCLITRELLDEMIEGENRLRGIVASLESEAALAAAEAEDARDGGLGLADDLAHARAEAEKHRSAAARLRAWLTEVLDVTDGLLVDEANGARRRLAEIRVGLA